MTSRIRDLSAVLLAAVVLAGCGATQHTHLDTSPNAYPAALQGSLTGACAADATTTAPTNLPAGYCQCALQTLEGQLPASQVGNTLTAGQAMLDDPDIRRACHY